MSHRCTDLDIIDTRLQQLSKILMRLEQVIVRNNLNFVNTEWEREGINGNYG